MIDDRKKIVTRIAPSPTGLFHIGTARTALCNYLYAKKNNGTFIVRMEDTDKKRSEKKFVTDIIDSLEWLEIKPDIIVYQSKRKNIYKKYIKRLIDSGDAYVSREPSKKDDTQEVSVIRFKPQNTKISFYDTVRGNITIDIEELGDFVIARSIDDPLYNLAVVIDDIEMCVTHIIRGDDHISNTPRQIALIQAFGGSVPKYTHMPLIHSPSGGKLSKRKDAASINEFRKNGYIVPAMINFLAFLGWNPKNEKEIFTIDELLDSFSLDGIQKNESIFDEKKLRWFQKNHVHIMSESDLRKEIIPLLIKRFPIKSRIKTKSVKGFLNLVREAGPVFGEEKRLLQEGKYDFLFMPPSYSPNLLENSKTKSKDDIIRILTGLEGTYSILLAIDEQKWNEEYITNSLWDYAEKNGKAEILWPLRVALSGKEKSPGPFLIASLIGKKETLNRLQIAIKNFKVYYK